MATIVATPSPRASETPAEDAVAANVAAEAGDAEDNSASTGNVM
jgi:hypothetical protein